MEGEKFHFEKLEGDALVSELKGILKQKLAANRRLLLDRYEIAADFNDSLKEKGYTIEEIKGCRLSHVLGGSSEHLDMPSAPIDLPEGEFEAFIRAL